jgi:hypothetical protein
MIIVSSFELNNNNSAGIYTITVKELINCPLCSGKLAYRDRKLRKLINLFGEIRFFLLRRLRCQSCKKLHTELPSIIQPYKHYDSDAIQSVLDNNEDESACTADNSTIRRWKTEFAEAKSGINQRLTSVYAQMTDEKVPIADTVNILDWIKSKTKRWLTFVMELLINSGHKICTQFAFCPPSISANVNSVSENGTEGGRRDDKTIKDTS